MSTAVTHFYEAMFVLSTKDVEGAVSSEDYIQAVCTKVGAKIVRLTKWDERQLAYEIKGQRDGVFFLAHLEGLGQSVAPLKREGELSDRILRLLVLRLNEIPSEEDVRKQSGRSRPEREEGEGSEASSTETPAGGSGARASAAAPVKDEDETEEDDGSSESGQDSEPSQS